MADVVIHQRCSDNMKEPMDSGEPDQTHSDPSVAHKNER